MIQRTLVYNFSDDFHIVSVYRPSHIVFIITIFCKRTTHPEEKGRRKSRETVALPTAQVVS